MEQKQIKLRYSDKELELISNTFAENEDLLMAIRKFFLQGEMLVGEMAVVKGFAENEQLLAVLRKTLLPEIDPDSPIHQNIDLWVSIDTKEQEVPMSYYSMQGRLIVVNYLKQQFDKMAGNHNPSGKTFNNQWENDDIQLRDLIFHQDKGMENAVIEMGARNTLLMHIDQHLDQLRILAGTKKETPEQIKARLIKDSSK